MLRKNKSFNFILIIVFVLFSACQNNQLKTKKTDLLRGDAKSNSLHTKVKKAFENSKDMNEAYSRWFLREEKLPLTIIATAYIDNNALQTKEYKAYIKLMEQIQKNPKLLDELSGQKISSKYSSIKFVNYHNSVEYKNKFTAAYNHRYDDKAVLNDVVRNDIDKSGQELVIRLNLDELKKGKLTIDGYKTVKETGKLRNSYYYTLRKTNYSDLNEEEKIDAIVKSVLASLQISIPQYTQIDRKDIVKNGEVLRFFMPGDKEKSYNGVVYSHASGGKIGKLEYRKNILRPLKLIQTIKSSNAFFSDIKAVAISSNGKHALTGGNDEIISLWNLRTNEVLKIFKGHTNNINSLKFSNDGKYALSGSDDNTLIYWDIKTGRILKILRGHTDDVKSIDISKDGRYAVSVSSDRSLRHWDLSTGKAINVMRDYTDGVNSVYMSEDGTLAITGSTDGNLRLWDLYKKRRIKILSYAGGPINAAVIGKDNKFAVATGTNNVIVKWDLTTSKGIKLEGHKGIIRALAISPDNNYLLSAGDDKKLIYWNLKNLKSYELLGHEKEVFALTISNDGGFALSTSNDKTLRQWKLSLTKKEKLELQAINNKLVELRKFATYRDDDSKQLLLTSTVSKNDFKVLNSLKYINIKDSSGISIDNINKIASCLEYNFLDPVILGIFPKLYKDISGIEINKFVLSTQISIDKSYDLNELYFTSYFDYKQGGYELLYEEKNIMNLKEATNIYRKEY